MTTAPSPRTLSAPPLDPLVRAWLDQFATLVRERDIETARTLFDADVGSFGTWTGRMIGLDTLVEQQWRNVWPKTCGFVFDLKHAFGHADLTSAWAAATWSSHALNADGTPGFRRSGRATFVFRRAGERLIAVHSHFSMDPAGRL